MIQQNDLLIDDLFQLLFKNSEKPETPTRIDSSFWCRYPLELYHYIFLSISQMVYSIISDVTSFIHQYWNIHWLRKIYLRNCPDRLDGKMQRKYKTMVRVWVNSNRRNLFRMDESDWLILWRWNGRWYKIFHI